MSEEKAESSTPSPIARRDLVPCLGGRFTAFDLLEGVAVVIASEKADVRPGCEANRAVWEGVRIRGETHIFLDWYASEILSLFKLAVMIVNLRA